MASLGNKGIIEEERAVNENMVEERAENENMEEEKADNDNVEEEKAENEDVKEQLQRVDNYFISIHGECLLVDRRKFKYSAPLYSPDANILEKNARLEDIIKKNCLPFLPAKSLSRFKSVSKEWNTWISGGFFAHIQTIHFKDISGLLYQSSGLDPYFISFNERAYGIPSPDFRFLPESVIIRTTSNGLVCCQSNFEHCYYICNPATKELKVLPMPKLYHGLEASVALAFEPTALGFDASFELVCAVPFYVEKLAGVYFETYSSSTNSWKTSETMCFENEVVDPTGNGLFMKGVVYWKTLTNTILAFDLKDEHCEILPLPAGSGNGVLTQMHGEICCMLPRIQEGECTISVYGNLDMSLKCVIPLKPEVVQETLSECKVLTCVENDTLVILLPSKVIAYHVKTQRVKMLSDESALGYEYCLPYINTLVPVK